MTGKPIHLHSLSCMFFCSEFVKAYKCFIASQDSQLHWWASLSTPGQITVSQMEISWCSDQINRKTNLAHVKYGFVFHSFMDLFHSLFSSSSAFSLTSSFACYYNCRPTFSLQLFPGPEWPMQERDLFREDILSLIRMMG